MSALSLQQHSGPYIDPLDQILLQKSAMASGQESKEMLNLMSFEELEREYAKQQSNKSRLLLQKRNPA
jgi:hypothetical protein